MIITGKYGGLMDKCLTICC